MEPPPPPLTVSYRLVLHAERAMANDTFAGGLLMFAVLCPLALVQLWAMPRLDLDPRLEWAGFIALSLVIGFWVLVLVPLRVVVDDAQLLLDFGGFRRRSIEVADILDVREVGAAAESREPEWRRRNGWSRWYSFVPGVVLELAGGEKLLVGSHTPRKLREAILHATELHKATATAVGVSVGGGVAPTRSPLPQ
jgi:hypothetical protein